MAVSYKKLWKLLIDKDSSNMRREEIISWVKHNNIYALGLPQSVISELEQL